MMMRMRLPASRLSRRRSENENNHRSDKFESEAVVIVVETPLSNFDIFKYQMMGISDKHIYCVTMDCKTATAYVIFRVNYISDCVVVLKAAHTHIESRVQPTELKRFAFFSHVRAILNGLFSSFYTIFSHFALILRWRCWPIVFAYIAIYMQQQLTAKYTQKGIRGNCHENRTEQNTEWNWR